MSSKNSVAAPGSSAYGARGVTNAGVNAFARSTPRRSPSTQRRDRRRAAQPRTGVGAGYEQPATITCILYRPRSGLSEAEQHAMLAITGRFKSGHPDRQDGIMVLAVRRTLALVRGELERYGSFGAEITVARPKPN